MTSFNLSDWALRHKSFVVYLMLVVRASPASAPTASSAARRTRRSPSRRWWSRRCGPAPRPRDTLQQVTDRIEKKLEELPDLDFVRSYTKPGESVVFVNLKDTVARRGRARPLVSGAQEDRRHPAHAAVGHRRARSSTTSSATPTRSSTPSPRTASRIASCATTPSACAPSCCACPTSPRSISSARRTRRSISSSRPSSSPRSASTSTR